MVHLPLLLSFFLPYIYTYIFIFLVICTYSLYVISMNDIFFLTLRGTIPEMEPFGHRLDAWFRYLLGWLEFTVKLVFIYLPSICNFDLKNFLLSLILYTSSILNINIINIFYINYKITWLLNNIFTISLNFAYFLLTLFCFCSLRLESCN